MPSSILLLRRIPAVSTKRIGPSAVSTTVSTESRVVPGMSWTTARSSPIRRLNSVDLPTLGRPTTATAGTSGRTGSPPPPAASSASMGWRLSSGNRATTSSSRSPVRRPCRALTGQGSPRPRASSSQLSASRRSLSALLATSSTSLAVRRSHSATSASSSVTPTEASTTNSTTSAATTACSTWRLTLASRSEPPGSQPPVSTTVNGMPSQSASSSLRSLVTPGSSSTITTWRPTMRFTSVLLPTLGRPTTATTAGAALMPRSLRGPGAGRSRRWPRPRRAGAGRRG